MTIGEREIAQHHIEDGATQRLQRAVETLMMSDYLYKDSELGQRASVDDGIASVSVWSDGVSLISTMGFKILLTEPWGTGSGLLVQFTN